MISVEPSPPLPFSIPDAESTSRTLRVGVLGCGTVGAAVCSAFHEQSRGFIAELGGSNFELVAVGVRGHDRARPSHLPPEFFLTDAADIVADESIDLVVEVIGGIEPPYGLVKKALDTGKSVVTANKQLIAERGPELLELSRSKHCQILFEAAVAGGIPLVRTLELCLASESLSRVTGILNGTTNLMLTEMTANGTSYIDALREAQRLGAAEADPTADVDGWDAVFKTVLLARLAFGVSPDIADVHREGIRELSKSAFRVATEQNCVIKLLAQVECEPSSGFVSARVHPCLIHKSHVLSGVDGLHNAVFIEGSRIGNLMLYGLGAGGGPTASAVLADMVCVARGVTAPQRRNDTKIGPRSSFKSRHCIVLQGSARSGVLATLDGVLARNGVGIASIERQVSRGTARIVITTLEASEDAVQASVKTLRDIDIVDSVDVAIRFFDDSTAAVK